MPQHPHTELVEHLRQVVGAAVAERTRQHRAPASPGTLLQKLTFLSLNHPQIIETAVVVLPVPARDSIEIFILVPTWWALDQAEAAPPSRTPITRMVTAPFQDQAHGCCLRPVQPHA